MSDLSNASFIPKQNPVKARRRIVSRQVYILSIISYCLISLALVAAAGTFFYELQVKKDLQSEIRGLSEAVKKFNQEDMDKVIALDDRLDAIATLVADNVSLRRVLTVIEDSTIQTFDFTGLTIDRTTNDTIDLEVKIETDSFDSVMFQRNIYEKADTIAAIDVSDVKVALATVGTEAGSEGVPAKVSLAASFSIDPRTVLFEPNGSSTRATPARVVAPTQASSSLASSTRPAAPAVSSSTRGTGPESQKPPVGAIPPGSLPTQPPVL